MSNAYSFLSTGNTFGDWVVTTNALVYENNGFNSNPYHKAAGTLYLDETGTAIQVAGVAAFQGVITSTGPSSTFNNNLTVQYGNLIASGIGTGLYVANNANVVGVVTITGPGVALTVANTANIGGVLNVTGATNLSNTLNVTNNVIFSNNLTVNYNINSGNLTSTYDTTIGRNVSVTGNGTIGGNALINGYLNVVGNSNINALQANVSVNTATLGVTGNAYVNVLQANTSVNTRTLGVTNSAYMNVVQANTSVNTATLGVTGSAYVNVLQSNTSVNTTTLGVTGSAYINFVQANTSVNSALITVTGNTLTDKLQANTSVNTANITVTSNVTTSNITIANTLYVSGNTYHANTINAVSDLIIGGKIYANTLLMNYAGSSANITSLTVPGTLTVTGSLIQSAPLVYNAKDFILSQATAITNGNYGTIQVNRQPGSNATIRWDETNKYWAILNVTSSLYNQITTNEQLSASTIDTSTFNVATSYALSSANTWLQSNVASSLTTAKAYTDSTNTFISNAISANVTSLQGQITTVYNKANTAVSSITGTTGTLTPTTGSISITSTNGITATGSGNTLTINTPQDVRTTASPTFASITLGTPLPVSLGGTGATNSTDALRAILPSSVGSPSGYVLATTGGSTPSFSWAAGGTGGGGGGATPGTTINSSRLSATGNSSNSQTIFNTPVYTPGASQLRVYVDGVRQFASEYAETSGNTANYGVITFNVPPPTGTNILFEVDGYIVNPYYANNIAYTVNGNIGTSANTIQLAIDTLTSKVAFSDSPALSGIVTAPTVSLSTSGNTRIATTAFVYNALANTGSTYAHSITGNAGTATALQTARKINTVSFDGTADITVTADASTLTGTTIKSTVVSSSLTSVGTIGTGTWQGSVIGASYGGTGVSTAANNTVFAGPGSGSAAAPGFRALVAADISSAIGNVSTSSFPTLNQNTTGTASNFTSSTTPNISVGTIGSGAITSTGAITTSGTITSTSSNVASGLVYTNYNNNNLSVSSGYGYQIFVNASAKYYNFSNLGDFTSPGSVTAYSDARLKSNITTITGALDIVNSMRGVRFDKDGRRGLGVIAQEVQKVLPEVVVEEDNEDKTLSVAYGNISGVLIEAIKELTAQVKELKAEIDELKGNNK